MNIINNTAAIAAIALLAVTGCTRESSSFDTQADAANANSARGQNVETTRVQTAEEMANDRMMMSGTHSDTVGHSADAAWTVAMAESDTTYRTAIARCDSQAGIARTQCKDQADSDLAAAKVRADAAKLAADPNG